MRFLGQSRSKGGPLREKQSKEMGEERGKEGGREWKRALGFLLLRNLAPRSSSAQLPSPSICTYFPSPAEPSISLGLALLPQASG